MDIASVWYMGMVTAVAVATLGTGLWVVVCDYRMQKAIDDAWAAEQKLRIRHKQ